ncbi:MAG: hypothetical protein AAF985_08500 [Bacteroidota bacterium]
MFDHFKNKILHPRQFTGVEVCLQGDQLCYHFVILKKQKGDIQIQQTGSDFNDFATLQKQLPKEVPIHLCLSGRGILHKLISGTGETPPQLFKQVLPNANFKQFHLQQIPGDQQTIVSLIRQDVLQQHLQQFKSAGFWPVDLSLGSFGIRQLRAFIDTSKGIGTTNQFIELDNKGQIRHFHPLSEPRHEEISIGGDRLATRLLPAYTSALDGLIQTEQRGPLPELNDNKTEYFHFIAHQKIKIGLIAAGFILLLTNTFCYYQLKDRNGNLQTDLFYQQKQLLQLDSLKRKLSQQKHFLQQSNLNQYSNASFFADQIGASLPKDLRLTELDIFPVKEQQRKQPDDHWMEYEHQKIKVKGHCKSSLQYNAWVRDLRQLSWVQSVKHLNYRDIDHQLGSFEMLINLSPSDKSLGVRQK